MESDDAEVLRLVALMIPSAVRCKGVQSICMPIGVTSCATVFEDPLVPPMDSNIEATCLGSVKPPEIVSTSRLANNVYADRGTTAAPTGRPFAALDALEAIEATAFEGGAAAADDDDGGGAAGVAEEAVPNIRANAASLAMDVDMFTEVVIASVHEVPTAGLTADFSTSTEHMFAVAYLERCMPLMDSYCHRGRRTSRLWQRGVIRS